MKYSLTYGEFSKVIQAVATSDVLQHNGIITLLQHQWYPGHVPIFWVNQNDAVIDYKEQSYGYVKIGISGLTNPEWLRTGISRYRKWHAYLNGEKIPIYEHYKKDESADAGKYCSVLVSDGTLEFRYEPEWIDWISYAISYASIIFLFCILFWSEYYINSIRLLFTFFLIPVFPYSVNTLFAAFWLYLIWILCFSPPLSSQFWYAGFMKNMVGTYDHAPDQFLDLEFGLFLGQEHINKTICEIELTEKRPDPFPPSNNKWSNNTQDWKYRLVDSSGISRVVYKNLPQSHILIKTPQCFEIYVGNPYTNYLSLSQGNYIPSGFQIECKVHFTDGSIFTTSAHPGSQGHKEAN
jgi:hypothetical protein